jgi:hypothetical protein
MKTSNKEKPATAANGGGRSGISRWTASDTCPDCTPALAVCQIRDDCPDNYLALANLAHQGGDYATYWLYRRRYLLAQAETYMQPMPPGGGRR